MVCIFWDIKSQYDEHLKDIAESSDTDIDSFDFDPAKAVCGKIEM